MANGKKMGSDDDHFFFYNFVPRNQNRSLSHKLFFMVEASIYLWVALYTCINVPNAIYRKGWENTQSNEAVLALACCLQLTSALLSFILSLLHECSSCKYRNTSRLSNAKRGQTNIQSIIILNESHEENDSDVDGKETSRRVGKFNYILQKTDMKQMGVSFGSTVPITFLLIPEIHSRVSGDDSFSDVNLSLGLLYAILLGSVGLSFALSTSFLSLMYTTSKRVNAIRENGSGEYDCNKDNESKTVLTIEEQGNVIHTMSLIFVIMIALIAHIMNHAIQIVIAFAIIESLLLLVYNGGIAVKTGCDTAKDSKELSTKVSPLQFTFTLGEWVATSSVISLLLCDYIFRYKGAGGIAWAELTSEADAYKAIYSGYESALPSDHLVIHAGIVGCLIGVCISTILVQNVVATFLEHSKRLQVDQISESLFGLILQCLLHITVVVSSTMMALNFALREYCLGNSVQEEFFWCAESNHLSDWNKDFGIISIILSHAPISIRWLVHFLTETEQNHPLHGIRGLPMPRYVWLLYWCAVLMVLGPIAVMIANKLKDCKDDRKKRLTVMARKYFHFVAVALFVPPTMFAPKMMGVSYAVAIALLVLLERVRTTMTVWNSTKKNLALKDERGIDFSNFFEIFFDEKDLGATSEGFVVTHIALLVGCGTPLWYGNVYHADSDVESILPFLGIISLGIGDSAGAIVGSLFGRRHWPGSRRSIEGSLAVFVSMASCTFCARNVMTHSLPLLKEMAVLILLAASEAVTFQIDNLCLPLLGVISFELLRL